ncbi:cystathionine beta-lyase [Candidatus Kirkpatrickella diaphorinae]|uniref:Cystathionine beta-lyase n=1 Tax=Candidatus Kirkpatrickella diaphorinae TaxID=2984322 RepID=A0ABY6GJP0_9PROT|nr:cystathionine beta-lyase [Candidatus Kirkpatrickella diaphorinae]UYH51752.1 cystathionine beta-lyase [Candidatus Kirkpatrickella diaphorinae]
MTDAMERRVTEGWSRFADKVVRAGRHDSLPERGQFINAPVARGSTVIFPSLAAMHAQGHRTYDHEVIYGAMGNPNQHLLERLIAEIEGGSDCQAVCSGLTACALPLLAFTEAGSHVLMSDAIYGPTRRFAKTMLRRFGVETSFYPPMASKETLQSLMRPETRIIVAESPGSHSFEVQDVPMIADVAAAGQAKLIVDNTWGLGIFQPFAHGAHISVQALTKYAGGHSDIILGAVTVNAREDWVKLRDAAIQLGLCANPDESWLTLRGLRTLTVRLEKQALTAYRMARWLQSCAPVARVLHPALEDCPGHDNWLRDFSGAGCLFGVALRPEITDAAMRAMIDRLKIFSIGASWGGYESLVMPTSGGIVRDHTHHHQPGPAFRLQIGLEDPETLKEDLATAMAVLQ